MVYAFIGLPLDIITGMADQAAKTGFPELAPEDALPYIGRDRGILRGPLEPAPGYRRRLLLWLEAWRGAGVGRAMLDQIAAYLTPNVARLRIWTQAGVVYTREPDGSFVIERAASDAWNWDNQTSQWARFWLVIYSVGGVPWSRSPVWGSPGHTWGEAPTTSRGSTAKVSEVQSIRSIVDEWKPALSQCRQIIVSFAADAFAPSDASPPLPAGTWGNYWDTPSLSASRDRRAIYWRGV